MSVVNKYKHNGKIHTISVNKHGKLDVSHPGKKRVTAEERRLLLANAVADEIDKRNAKKHPYIIGFIISLGASVTIALLKLLWVKRHTIKETVRGEPGRAVMLTGNQLREIYKSALRKLKGRLNKEKITDKKYETLSYQEIEQLSRAQMTAQYIDAVDKAKTEEQLNGAGETLVEAIEQQVETELTKKEEEEFENDPELRERVKEESERRIVILEKNMAPSKGVRVGRKPVKVPEAKKTGELDALKSDLLISDLNNGEYNEPMDEEAEWDMI